jgi:cell wall-associated NlpC family hydrolase
MPIKRLTAVAVLASLLLAAGSLQAQVAVSAKAQAPVDTVAAVKTHTPAKTHTSKTHAAAKAHTVAATHSTHKVHAFPKTRAKVHSRTPAHVARKNHKYRAVAHVAAAQSPADSAVVADASTTPPAPSSGELTFNIGPSTSTAIAEASGQAADVAADPAADNAAKVTDLRKALIGLAMNLRDTRYVRGGRDPSTGFDCSGFVRYVFAHAIGMKLPTNSASQFLAGLKVDRADMKPGDLVFFQTGRKHHISHVGIYLSNGRFIHSPATGKTVQVSSLSESYWARHFAGAKRPSGIVAAADNG